VLAGLGYRIDCWFLFFFLLHLICFALLGFIVAMVVTSHADQAAFSTFVITPMIFLSDTFYPIDKMPFFVRPLGYIFPLTYSTKLIRATLLGKPFELINAFVLLIITVVLFVVALWVARRAEA
jgi:ABC-2 type transport system permease protein